MATIEEPYSRRDFLQASGTLLSGMAIVPFVSMDTPNDDAMLLHEVKLLQGMAENTYKQLWAASVQDIQFAEVKERFGTARSRVSELSKSLSPEQLRRD